MLTEQEKTIVQGVSRFWSGLASNDQIKHLCTTAGIARACRDSGKYDPIFDHHIVEAAAVSADAPDILAAVSVEMGADDMFAAL